MDTNFSLIIQTASMILGGMIALYALKRLGWLRVLYKNENQSIVLIAIVSVVVNIGILIVRMVF